MLLPHDVAGDGPPVLLVHAGVCDRRMWREHLEPIAQAGFRAIAVDLPGFGDAPPSAALPWDEIVPTLDGLGVDEAVTIVGCSFGGAVALRVAAIAPARVRALMLLSAPDWDLDPSPQLTAAAAAEDEALERGDVEAAVQAVVDAWTLPDAPASVKERVAEMQRRAFALQLANEDDDEEEDEHDPLAGAALDVPALIVVGEHDMPDFHASAESFAARLPGSRRVVIDGAGHLAPLETPEPFRALLLEFLERRA